MMLEHLPSSVCTISTSTYHDIELLVPVWLEMVHLHQHLDPAFKLHPHALKHWKDMMQQWIRRYDARVFSAVVDGNVVGFVSVCVLVNAPIYQEEEIGFVSELAVLSSMRRKGIGRALLEKAQTWFFEQGLHAFQLSAAMHNPQAKAFWEAVGGKPLLVRYQFNARLNTPVRVPPGL